MHEALCIRLRKNLPKSLGLIQRSSQQPLRSRTPISRSVGYDTAFDRKGREGRATGRCTPLKAPFIGIKAVTSTDLG